MERHRGFETRRLVIVVLLFSVLALPLFLLAGCGEQLTRMEENQTKLQAMVAANARDLATISAQLHTGQGKINESLQTLDGGTQQVAAGVTAVRNEQRQFQEAVAAGHEGLDRRITQVQESQGVLQAGVAQVSEVTQRTAADLTSLARDHAALQEAVQANQRELAGSLGAVVNNQQRIQTGLGDLRQASQGLAGDLASLATKNDTLYATLQDHGKQLAERLTILTSGHGQLCADITNVHTLLQTMATDLTTANSSLKDQLGLTDEKLTAQITRLSASQQQLQTGLDTLGGKADQTTAELADTKSSLQETLRVSREVLTGQMAASLQNQEALQGGVRDLSDKTDKLTTNISEVAAEQAALHQTVHTNQNTVVTAMAGLSDRQEALRGGIDNLDAKTERVAGKVATLATQQQSLYEAVKANQDVVTAKLADVSQSQTTLQSSINGLDGKAEAIVSTQNNLRLTLQHQNESVGVSVAELANDQQTLRTQMDTLTATASQTALDVLALNDGQAALQQAVRAAENNLGEKASRTSAGVNGVAEQQAALQQSLTAGTSALAARATELGQNQQALQSRMDNLDQATQRVASDLARATAGQESLHQALKTHSDNANQQATVLATGQEQMKTDLDTLAAMTGQSSLDILAVKDNQAGLTQTVKAAVADVGTRADKVATGLTAVATGQNSLSETLNRQGQAASTQMAKITDSQQQMQNGLDTLTGTTSQTALDVIAMTTRQDALQAALQSHDQASGTEMAKLAENQQQMQSGLDVVTATTGQASLDALALGTSQDRLGQAVQTSRQEMTARLATLAQSQQVWSDRLDNAQAKVATIADNIAALEQQIAKLQTVLQTGLQDTTALLGTTGQQRVQFETKVTQDVQAVIDSLGQLRQMQTSLQEQITQVQRSTQGQADSLRSVVEQMKATPNATDRAREQTPAVEDPVGVSAPTQPPAEVKVSSAAETPEVSETRE